MFKYRNFLKNYFKYQPSSLVASGAFAHRQQGFTACKSKYGHKGAPKGTTGFEKVSIPGFLGTPINSRKVSFLLSIPSMKKVEAGQRKKLGKEVVKNIGK